MKFSSYIEKSDDTNSDAVIVGCSSLSNLHVLDPDEFVDVEVGNRQTHDISRFKRKTPPCHGELVAGPT